VTTPHDAFRRAAGRFASGVTVVTTAVPVSRVAGGTGAAEVFGITVSSFASLSLNPLLVSVSVRQESRLLPLVRSSRLFAVSVLGAGQRAVADHFAGRGRRPEPHAFAAVDAGPRVTGAPVVTGCVSWFDCEVDDILPGGDHEILVGRVVAAGGAVGAPLVYWGGAYQTIEEATRQPAPGAAGGTPDRSDDDVGSDHAPGLAEAADGLAVALHILDVGVEEMLLAQLAVEPALCALAAARGTAADWDRLMVLVERSAEVVDEPAAFNALSIGTHDAIAEIGGNRVLRAALLGVRRVQGRHFTERGSHASAVAAVAEHRALLAALRTADGDRAGAAMTEHLRSVRGRLLAR
jgi:flavin reductase (DIM6/NTAB) family NADH-FMN oxidoreductase RutF